MSHLLKVFGHKSPDTDATCCAVLWAWYQNAHTSQKAEAFILPGELNKETLFVLNEWNVPAPKVLESVGEGDELVIVDTNNPQELLEGVKDATIVAIVDHHKLVGGLTSGSPITVYMKPLASTASVIYDVIGEAREDMPKDMMGLMLSCILSDTLEFRSPTTTPHDKMIAETLAKKLGISIPEYAAKMFASKSDISDFTDHGLVHLDSKKFEVGDKNIRVSVLETTTPTIPLGRKEGIIAAIKKTLSEESGTDDVLMFIVDILKEEATALTYSELTKDIIEKSFEVKVTGDTVVLPGIVSRKKQIVPALKI